MARRGNPRLDAVRPKDTSKPNEKRTELADAKAREVLVALEEAYHEHGVKTNGERAKWLNAYSYRREQPDSFNNRMAWMAVQHSSPPPRSCPSWAVRTLVTEWAR